MELKRAANTLASALKKRTMLYASRKNVQVFNLGYQHQSWEKI